MRYVRAFALIVLLVFAGAATVAASVPYAVPNGDPTAIVPYATPHGGSLAIVPFPAPNG